MFFLPLLEERIQFDSLIRRDTSFFPLILILAQTFNRLLKADLLKRLEEVDCQPGEGGRQAVFKVSLIRDFKGKLHNMRRVVERAKKIGERNDELTAKEEKDLADAEEELKHLNLEDKDVLGAFVTFTYIKFKDFVSILNFFHESISFTCVMFYVFLSLPFLFCCVCVGFFLIFS